MNAYDRLMQEAIPTRPAAPQPDAAWTPEEQAEHRRILLAALHGWHWHDETRISRKHRRHLHVVDDAEAA